MQLKFILETLVKGIVQKESEVIITETYNEEKLHGKEPLHLLIKVAKEDIPLLVGKKGSTISALRILLNKIAGKYKQMVFIDIKE